MKITIISKKETVIFRLNKGILASKIIWNDNKPEPIYWEVPSGNQTYKSTFKVCVGVFQQRNLRNV